MLSAPSLDLGRDLLRGRAGDDDTLDHCCGKGPQLLPHKVDEPHPVSLWLLGEQAPS
jgi:hypothetical protein